MIWRNRWVVLVPGNPVWAAQKTREILEDFDEGNNYTFTIIPGRGRYNSIVETGDQETELYVVVGEAFSREVDEIVYSIEGRTQDPIVSSFLKGVESHVDKEPDELVRSLGCTVPWLDEPPPPPPVPFTRRMRTVALIQGVSVAKIRKTLEKVVGEPLPSGYHRLEETPQGVLLTDGTGPLGSAHVWLTERLPRATVYSVTATSTLDSFVVTIMRGKQFSEFMHPPGKITYFPISYEVMGERTPEAILAAMGIPKEWFQL